MNRYARAALRSRLLMATSATLGVKFPGAAISFLLQILLARVLGAEQYGVYAYVFTWVIAVEVIGAFGLDTASVRFVAVYHSKEQWSWLRGFCRRAYQLSSVIGCGVGLAMAGVVGALLTAGLIRPELAQVFWIAAVLLPLFALIQTQAGVLRGLGGVITALGPREIVFRVTVAGLVGALVVTGIVQVRANVAMWITVAAALGATTLLMFILRAVQDDATHEVAPTFATREWLGTAGPMAVTAGATNFMRRVDVLAVGTLVGTTLAGIYAVATRIIAMTRYGLNAVDIALAPEFARLHALGQIDSLRRLAFRGAWLTALLALPLLVALIVGAPWILALFGKDFIQGVTIVRILAAGELVNVLTGSNGLLMDMAGLQRRMAHVVTVTAVAALAAIPLAVWGWGAPGAAVAASTMSAVRNLWVVQELRVNLGVNPTVFSVRGWQLERGSLRALFGRGRKS